MSEVRAGSGAGLDPIDALVFEYLERVDSGERVALDDYCRSKGEHERALRERLVALERAGLVGIGAAAADASFPERLGDFRLIERLGGGGMGVVYLAEQTSLGREVALKLIRPDQLYFPGARERFRREVEAVARLAHPGIVPVYTFGEEGGLPYFAMEHVQGASLAHVLEALAGRAPESLSGRDLARAAGADETAPLFAGTWINACLRIARQVAEALEHAHERGVLHRDVKPSNVILTRDGVPRLLDFGLATRAGADRLTRTGAQVGSIPYMPPELAGGDSARATAASDVYSLGVMLYELATLRLPYSGDTTAATLARIAEGRPEPPRRLNPSVSLDAETVCLAAMEVDPVRRYPSARAFAQDLARVLELKPIAARRASSALKLRRWIQRNPARASAAALALLVVVGGPIGYGTVQAGARGRIEAANQKLARANVDLSGANAEIERTNADLARALEESRTQRGRAERNLGRAREAVERMLTRVGDKTLANVPRMERVRSDLLQDALALQREFLEESRADPSLRREVAEAELRCARILSDLGRTGDAEASYRAAIEAFEAGEGEPGAVERSAFASRSLAVLLNDSGRRPEGLARIAASLEKLDPLADAPEATASLRTIHAQLVATRGELERLEGRMDEAQASWSAALAEFDALLEEDADPETTFASREGRARTLVSLGRALLVAGLARDAEPIFQDAIEAWSAIAAERPGEAVWEAEVATCELHMCNALFMQGRFVEAKPHVEASLAIKERIAADFPATPNYQVELAGALGSLAAIEADAGNYEAALGALKKSREMVEALVAEQPESVHLRVTLAQVLVNQGATLMRTGAIDDAAAAFEAGLRELDRGLGQAVDDPRLVEARVVTGINLALLELERKSHERAVAALPDLSRWPGAREHMGAAFVYAEACNLASADAGLVEQYAQRAVEEIRTALAGGYGDRNMLETDESFESLRGRADFRALLAGLPAAD